MLFGGYDGVIFYGDTWEYDGTDWTELTLTTNPAPRYGSVLVYNALLGHPVLFGGVGDQSGASDQTWILRPGSATDDERCDNATDDDGDGATDCGDPDCEGMPCATGACVGGACQ